MQRTDRKSWHSYFMDIARQVATRATCPRKHVGAVIVRNRQILATGYNGSMWTDAHCTEAGCLLERSYEGGDHCVRTVHAEVNAIAQAARNGAALDGGHLTMYTTAFPCWNCYKVIANAGIDWIVADENYNVDERILERAANGLGPTVDSLAEAVLYG